MTTDRTLYGEEGTSVEVAKAAEPTYAYRPVVNAAEIVAWAKEQGMDTTLTEDDLHVTVVFSRRPYNGELYYSGNIVVRGGNRFVQKFGDATVLVIDSCDLVDEWNFHRRMGASWDHPGYTPHVTITYKFEGDVANVLPYPGDIVLGPTVLEPMNEKWSDGVIEKNEGLSDDAIRARLSDNMDTQITKSSTVTVMKTDDERRVVWGWASVATLKGEPVYDSHDEHIPMEELEKAATEFMLQYRIGKVEHDGPKVSEIFCLLPLSKSLAEALEIQSDREGLIVGYKVYDDEVWKMIKSGELGELSIGGRATVHEA